LDNAIARKGKYMFFDADTGAPTVASAVDLSAITVSAFAETYLDDANALATMATLQGVSVFNVTNSAYGAVGDGVTDDELAIEAAITDATVNGGTVYFPPTANSYLITGAITSPANVTLKFAQGATITRDAAATMTISGPIDAEQRMIWNGFTKGEITFTDGAVTEVYPEWFGDGTDYGVMISSAIASIKTVGGTIVFSRIMQASTGVDCTATRSGIIFEGRGSPHYGGGLNQPRLKFTMSGGNAFDCTGADAVTFRDWVMDTDTSTFPDIGILIARGSDGATGAQGHTFINFTMSANAKFGVAAYYNYGVEELNHYGCHFSNSVNGAKAIVITANNVNSISSAFTAMATGNRSTTVIFFHGGRYSHLGSAGDSDIFYIENSSDIHLSGIFMLGQTGTRSLVYFDGDNGASNMFSISGMRGEVGARPTTAFQYVSDSPITFVNHSFTSMRLDPLTDFINAGANSTLSNFRVQSIFTQSNTGIVATSMSNSHIDFAGNQNIAISGTSSQNIFQGVRSNFSVGTRDRDILFDLDNGSWDIAGVPAYGGTPQVLTGPGVINVTTAITEYVSNGGAQALTIANGLIDGQVKYVVHKTDGGSGVLTGANFAGTSLTFTDDGDAATLLWTSSMWFAVGGNALFAP